MVTAQRFRRLPVPLVPRWEALEQAAMARYQDRYSWGHGPATLEIWWPPIASRRRLQNPRSEAKNQYNIITLDLMLQPMLPLARLHYRVWCEKAAEARSVLVESPK